MVSDSGPGPLADKAFERGLGWAAVLGIGGIGLLFWLGFLSPTDGFHLMLVVTLFPVYLVFISVVLGVWLGYDTDATDLRPVDEGADTEDPWERWR